MNIYLPRHIRIILFMFCMTLMLPETGNAQQIPNFSLYNKNHYLINPAASGVTDMLPVSLSFRKQYAGFDQSPTVAYASGDMKVAPDMGVGAKLFNYTAGPLRKTGFEGSYSYHIALGTGETKLSFGLSLLLYQFHLDKSQLAVEDIDDQVFMGQDQMFVPDASVGTYLYGKKYYVGLSVPQLFQKNIDMKDAIIQQKQVRHYYLHGGYIFDAGSDFKIEPSLLLKFTESGIFQVDVNALATYKDMVDFGISYRSQDAMVFQAGFNLPEPKLFIGYAYDLVLNGMRSHTWGSHEILLTYTIGNFITK